MDKNALNLSAFTNSTNSQIQLCSKSIIIYSLFTQESIIHLLHLLGKQPLYIEAMYCPQKYGITLIKTVYF